MLILLKRMSLENMHKISNRSTQNHNTWNEIWCLYPSRRWRITWVITFAHELIVFRILSENFSSYILEICAQWSVSDDLHSLISNVNLSANSTTSQIQESLWVSQNHIFRIAKFSALNLQKNLSSSKSTYKTVELKISHLFLTRTALKLPPKSWASHSQLFIAKHHFPV